MQETLSAKAAQTQETRDRILKAALKLFNDQGAESVTTHDIAEEAGISPGNLYYHFKNKKEIVRELFYRIEVLSVNEWWQKSPVHREVRFSDFMRFYFGSLVKYRFFFKDFSTLLNQDPILAKLWRTNYARLFSVMREALKGWVKAGLIKPFKSQIEADIFIETIWILAGFSQVHLEARLGKTKKGYVEAGHEYIARFLYPYHTEKGQKVIDLFMAP